MFCNWLYVQSGPLLTHKTLCTDGQGYSASAMLSGQPLYVATLNVTPTLRPNARLPYFILGQDITADAEFWFAAPPATRLRYSSTNEALYRLYFQRIRSRVLSPESKLEFRAENDINFKDYGCARGTAT